MEAFFQAVSQVLGIVLGSSSAATLSGVGIILLLLTAVMAYIALARTPEETPNSLKAALYLCLVGGIIFSAAGPSEALFDAYQNPIRTESTDEIFHRLINNTRVRYVVRLISYAPGDQNALGIDKIAKLGPSRQQYSFVGDYEELKGRTVADALDMVGTGYNGSDHVTAIIFPLHVNIFPANARGLLQVISNVEGHIDAEQKYIKPETFNETERRDLRETNINS